MRHISISLRLTAWYACVSALGLAIFGFVMWFVLADSMISWKDRTLQMRAVRTEAVINSAPRNDRRVLEQKLEEVVGLLPEGEWIQIVGANGRRLFPLSRVSDPGVVPLPCATALYRDRLVNAERFRELCRPVTYESQPAFLLVPSPLSEDRILLRNFTSGLYRMIPVLLLVSALGGYMLSRRALAPVDVIIAEARTVTAHDLSRRLSVSTADDQLRRLAVEWNNLLSRIESAMIRVTQFSADASHELRSPIAFIRATAEYQLDNPALDDELREVFRTILDETTMTTELLEDLLLLARPDMEEKLMRSVHPVDVCALTTDLALHFEPSLRKLNHELIVRPPVRSPLMIRMSAGHARRVLTAVLDNAIKYTPQGGRIYIEYEESEFLYLRITDTGVGIAAEHLDRIFDRFFRVDQARTKMDEGVGLGLPITKRLMEQYGGSVSVRSQLGAGTSVLLTFPWCSNHNRSPEPDRSAPNICIGQQA